jgi:hypothetical protein
LEGAPSSSTGQPSFHVILSWHTHLLPLSAPHTGVETHAAYITIQPPLVAYSVSAPTC